MENIRKKVFLIIPTIRNLHFLKNWGSEFMKCHLVIVEDNDEKTVKSKNLKFASVSHFCHQDIKKDFKENYWVFSRKNAGIRSYGFWKAYKMGADVLITLDDDCYPAEGNFIEKHLQNLRQNIPENWQPTYPDPEWMYTRGFPYLIRDKHPVMVSHGLWSGALDLDAKTEIKLPGVLHEKTYPPLRQIISFNYFYPMCSMNLAFKREIVPLMFFPMMGQKPDGSSWPYNRYDDIWAGLFSKKIMDHLNFGVINGSPFVEHRKASKSKDNYQKEIKGMKINEILWKRVSEVKLTKNTPKSCYIELANKINFPKGKYFEKLREAMIIWANLF
jgi:reversibly glycosylated polypeptide / UDP-arabinopyranose mutase